MLSLNYISLLIISAGSLSYVRKHYRVFSLKRKGRNIQYICIFKISPLGADFPSFLFFPGHCSSCSGLWSQRELCLLSSLSASVSLTTSWGCCEEWKKCCSRRMAGMWRVFSETFHSPPAQTEKGSWYHHPGRLARA